LNNANNGRLSLFNRSVNNKIEVGNIHNSNKIVEKPVDKPLFWLFLGLKPSKKANFGYISVSSSIFGLDFDFGNTKNPRYAGWLNF